MLFKEKLLLSNCDSVRRLEKNELRKRFLMGMAFGDGVVLSPNTLIDNPCFDEFLTRKNLVKYLNEEGSGKLVIRGFNIEEEFNLESYYEKLPGNFIFSSFEGNPVKSDLNNQQEYEIRKRLEMTQESLNAVVFKAEGVMLEKNALQEEILSRIADDSVINYFFEDDGARELFKIKAEKAFSRSDWYKLSDSFIGNSSAVCSNRFKVEVVNPAYNSLFAAEGEGFLQDNIKFLSGLPEKVLDVGVAYKSLKNEIELIQYPYRAFEMISTLGSKSIVQFLTEQALGYIEDKLEEKFENVVTRRNWFGMYPKMQKYIGLELK